MSGHTLDVGSVTEALKEHYKPLRVQNMVYQDNPLLALMPKYTKFGGENMPIPLIYANPQRRSADFTIGKGINDTSALRQFVLTRVKDYSFASITGESIKATERDTDAFLRYASMEIDGALHSLTRSLAISMYRDGSGSLATVSGQDAAGTDPGGSSATIYVANAEDITNFEVGMAIQFYADSSGKPSGSARAGGAYTISAIDRSASNPFITFSGNVNVAVANGDHLVQNGDLNAKISGLEAWVPTPAVVTAGIPNLFSAVRTTDVTRLGGNRFDGSALPIEEALIGAAAQVSREGGRPDVCMVDFATFSNLEKALGSKVVYSEAKARDVDIGFSAISLRGPRGTIKVVPDQNCHQNVAWMLQMDTWSLNTLGEAPMFLDLDNNRMLRESDADAYEVRLGYYGNVACNAPGYNCRVAL
tara:strand:+ start:97 stop:1350 length:1254 start_codon:yes stop_codon:yes gene_type:complete